MAKAASALPDRVRNCSRQRGFAHFEKFFAAVFAQGVAVEWGEVVQGIRDGIANMLLMLSVLHAEVGLDAGSEDPSAFVDRLVGGLPGLRDDERVIMSLERQLPVLMEAAPDPLVSTLELLLEGYSEKIAPIFNPFF